MSIFSKIIAGEIPCHKVFETERTLAFLDINPLSPGHTLVIPKECKAKVHELSPESLADLGVVLGKVAAVVGGENYNVLQNNGSLAHQEVMHVHFHIIPKPNETLGLSVRWSPLPTDHAAFALQAQQFRERLQA
jgi:diadenosine tetraphosphate (Ap4A) HIT family hydrolase